MTIFIRAHSLTTKQLRRALVANNRAVKSGDAPTSITTTDSAGKAFVGVCGPDSWTFESMGLTPEQAVAVAQAIAGDER